jgi:hypothetical protein
MRCRMKTDSFSCSSKRSLPRVTCAMPFTTTQCSERCWWT